MVNLLNASFEQWSIDAQAVSDSAGTIAISAPDGSIVLLHEGAAPMGTSVRAWAGENADAWLLESGNPNASTSSPKPIRSVSGVLLDVRSHLDPTFVAGRSIIGQRPILSDAVNVGRHD
ncbi:MAG: hypothetical protein ACI8PT_000860 [Gammaproteobacteria bacterium]|jgi:hypothetical protein